MSNDVLNVLAANLQILTRIERCRILTEDSADTSGHAEAKVGVDVDLADCAACCFTKLIFRNTDGIPAVRRKLRAERSGSPAVS